MLTTYGLRWVFIITMSAALFAQRAPGAAGSVETLVAGETKFALDLYSQLRSGDGNLFLSPYSISTCLGMTYIGARGSTATQMAKVLHFKVKPEELPASMDSLEKRLNEIKEGGSVELSTANGLWAQTGYPFRHAFLQACGKDFGARTEQVNFTRNAEKARKDINYWVADQTRNRIKDLVAPKSLNEATVLVLVNAIYFKGTWEHPFAKSATWDDLFATQSGQKVNAHFMRQTAEFKYAESDDLQVLEMSYQSPREPLSMDILLPRGIHGLRGLEKSLSQRNLDQWLASRSQQKVNVFIPKFKMTNEFEMTKTLQAMGMSLPFSRKADFSGMDGTDRLFITAAVHQAFVDVNEEGTEAAAATYVEHSSRGIVKTDSIPIFRADHPFIFLIRDTTSGSILFLGRVTDPTK